MLTCQFCGLTSTAECGDFQMDPYGKGYWCEDCDSYTYLDNNVEKHRFILILEDKTIKKTNGEAPKKKFSKRLSPYRYPGGKSKMIDHLHNHLRKTKSKQLISPYTGGGSFELAMLEAGIVEKLHLNDIDFGVYALWWVIKHIPDILIDQIKRIQPTHKDYYLAQERIKSKYAGADLIDAAWASLIVNRLAYSGIAKANPLGGRNGSRKTLLSRWNPDSLIQRINKVHALSHRIKITNINAIELIEEAYWINNATIFIDPPYVKKGKDLYPFYYTETDHRELAQTLDLLYAGFPGADIIVTYDYTEWLDNIYEYPERERIGCVYSA